MRVPVTLVVVPRLMRDDDSLCPITNRARTVGEAVPLAQAYRRRWGIETSYRKIGESSGSIHHDSNRPSRRMIASPW